MEYLSYQCSGLCVASFLYLKQPGKFHENDYIRRFLVSKLNAAETRSTKRAQTFLAEGDHYTHIAHCKNVEPWW